MCFFLSLQNVASCYFPWKISGTCWSSRQETLKRYLSWQRRRTCCFSQDKWNLLLLVTQRLLKYVEEQWVNKVHPAKCSGYLWSRNNFNGQRKEIAFHYTVSYRCQPGYWFKSEQHISRARCKNSILSNALKAFQDTFTTRCNSVILSTCLRSNCSARYC